MDSLKRRLLKFPDQRMHSLTIKNSNKGLQLCCASSRFCFDKIELVRDRVATPSGLRHSSCITAIRNPNPRVLKTDYMTASAPSDLSRLVAAKTTKTLGRKGAEMLIIGCDFHPRFQQIAYVVQGNGE